jgi:hypothetical protein
LRIRLFDVCFEHNQIVADFANPHKNGGNKWFAPLLHRNECCNRIFDQVFVEENFRRGGISIPILFTRRANTPLQ